METLESSLLRPDRGVPVRSFQTNARFYVPEHVIGTLHDVAAAASAAVLVDVDALERSARAKVDRVMLLALEALSCAHLQVIVISKSENRGAELLRRGVPRSWWFDRHSGWREPATNPARLDHAITAPEVIEHVHERIPDAHLIAISDDPALLGALFDQDRGISMGSRKHIQSRSNVAAAGDLSVRAVLWWLVDVRARTASARP